jgi:hypothetical protein
MVESVWRRRAPLWLRILAGILLLPLLAIVLFVATRAFGWDTPLVWLFVIGAVLAWVIALRAPTPVAAVLSGLAVLGFALPLYLGQKAERTFGDIGGYLDQAPSTESEAGATPLDQAAPKFDPLPVAPDEAPKAEAPGPDLSAPSGGGGGYYEAPSTGGGFDDSVGIEGGGGGGGGEFSSDDGGTYLNGAPLQPPLPDPSLQAERPRLDSQSSGSHNYELPSGGSDGSVLPGNPALQPPQTERAGQLPEFPWPPPSASTSYVLPDRLFANFRNVGEVTGAILGALEQNGYVERSFFRTPPGGVALVTRLERINDDGSPTAEARWPAGDSHTSTRSLLDLLQGLFYVDPGHYRVIVFVAQDLPFSQSAETITAQQAQAWLTIGTNILPPEIAARPFTGGHVTVLIYEFASDGTKVQVVTSQLTGKEHLERAGVLAILDKVQ